MWCDACDKAGLASERVTRVVLKHVTTYNL